MKYVAELLFNLQRGERGTALLLTGYHFLLLLCLYLLKPVRDGLFLADRGTAELPFVFLLVAAVTIPVGLLQRWLGQEFRLDRLTNRLTVALLVALLGVSLWSVSDIPGGAYAVYVYVSIYGVMATSQFWLFAGGLLTSSQSKRSFALVNLGGIVGAVAGGELTGWLLGSNFVTPATLLFVAAAVLTSTLPLAVWIRRYYRTQMGEEFFRDEDEASGETNVIRHVFAPRDTSRIDRTADARSEEAQETNGKTAETGGLTRLRDTVVSYPLVGWIAALIAVTAVVSTLLDYQLKTAALHAFPEEAEVTAFFGRFYGRVSLLAMGFQLLLSTGLKRRIRSTSALWVLPTVLLLGTAALALVPVLAAATFLRGADQSLKHSIDKTSREILYLPLPQSVKRRVKVPLDLFIDQVADGIGGVLLVGLVLGLGLEPANLAPVIGALAILWIGIVYKSRTHYLDQFRDSIRSAKDNLRPMNPAPDSTMRTGKASTDWANASDFGSSPEQEGPPSTTRSAPEARNLKSADLTSADLTSGDVDSGDLNSDDPDSDDDEAFIEGPISPAGREQALQRAGRYIVNSQLLALRTGAVSTNPPLDPARLPSESVLRHRRMAAFDDLFDVLLEWIPRVQDCPAEDLRLAAEALHHPSSDVRSDAISLLDGLLSGSIRRRLVPLLDDPDGHQALKDAPPLYRFYAGRTRRPQAPPG